jgi:hypothetical protein
MLLLDTGARHAELTGLRLADVELDLPLILDKGRRPCCRTAGPVHAGGRSHTRIRSAGLE